jgi:AcrR family transcriptional regulator
MGKTSRKELLTIRRREQILNSALEIFSQKGFASSTIPEIARAAGLAPGTIYLYFSSKRELFIKVVESLIVTPLIDIFESDSTSDFSTALQTVLENRLQFLHSPVLSRLILMMSEIQRDDELRNYFKGNLVQPLFERMGRIFKPQLEGTSLSKVKPEIIVRLVGGMMIGLSLLRNLEREDSPLNALSRERLAQIVQHFILNGINGRTTAEGA